jgi:hypothetical protein
MKSIKNLSDPIGNRTRDPPANATNGYPLKSIPVPAGTTSVRKRLEMTVAISQHSIVFRKSTILVILYLGYSFLAETCSPILTGYNVVFTECNIHLYIIRQRVYPTLK